MKGTRNQLGGGYRVIIIVEKAVIILYMYLSVPLE